MTMNVAGLLDQAGLPAGNLLDRRNALSAPLQKLHRRALQAIALTGRPPMSDELVAWAQESHLDLTVALGALAETELVFVDPSGHHITGGVPFAAHLTPHQVRIADGPTVSANCALDALGIAAMVDRDTDIRSTDPHTGETIDVTSRRGRWTWRPADAVVFIGSAGEGRITDMCCPVINFFAAADNATAYQQQNDLVGVVLPLPAAAEAGAAIFADLLRDAPIRAEASNRNAKQIGEISDTTGNAGPSDATGTSPPPTCTSAPSKEQS